MLPLILGVGCTHLNNRQEPGQAVGAIVDSASPDAVICLESNGTTYYRWAVRVVNGDIKAQYVEGASYVDAKVLIDSFQTNTWYTAILKIDSDPQLFRMEVYQRDNPGLRGSYTRHMPDGLSWRFRHYVYSGSSYLDNYYERSIGSDVVYVGNLYEKDLLPSPDLETKYYYYEGKRVATRQGGTLSYLLTDHLGSPVSSYRASDGAMQEMRYLSYGGSRSSHGGLPTSRLYTGQLLDDSSGLYQVGARWYDPALDRFLSPDTAVPGPNQPQAFNRYSYGLNNPLKYRDPSGHWIETAFDVAMVALDVVEVRNDPSPANVAALVVDGAAAVLPFVPAGAGLVVRAGKAVTHGDEVVKVGTEVIEHADEAVDVAKGLEKGLEGAANEAKVAEKAETGVGASERPSQIHHIASNKSSQYTPEFEKIATKYELDLNGNWNKMSMPHQGRHPNAYHDWVLGEMRAADSYAQGNKAEFLEYYQRNTINPVVQNPDMLRGSYWR